MQNIVRNEKQMGNIIRRERRKLNLTQTELGEKTNIHQETISRIEAGNSATKLQTLLSVLGALNLEIQLHTRSKIDEMKIEDMF